MASEKFGGGAWLARGVEAYQKRRFDEAVEHFENAVAIDPGSVQANLALGATRFTFYMRDSFPPPPDFSAGEPFSDEWEAFRERQKVIRAEQNSTNWPMAEKSLRRANQLDPQDKLVIEYLCALYFSWKDLLDEQKDRMDEAKKWLERLAELDPENKYANCYCGMILSGKARKLLPNYGRLPPVPEPDLASVRAKAGPLLEEAHLHLARALALHGEQTGAARFLEDVTSMQTYLADPNKSARDLREKLTDLFHKQVQAGTVQTETGTRAAPSSSSTITFHLSAEALAEDRERPFPPNPWRIPAR